MKKTQDTRTRARINVQGLVQGVGFRPFVHKLAQRFGLKGWVKNTTVGVDIEVEGNNKKEIISFYRALSEDKPSPAEVKAKRISFLPPWGYKSFSIKESAKERRKEVLISPDIAICKDCMRELENVSDRRYLYPFINCTNCGPRFTIIQDLPYDRALTTMKKFKMCALCEEEYENIFSRRYHAQPNACANCGPDIQLVRSKKPANSLRAFPLITQRQLGRGLDALRSASHFLRRGKIVAIKGLGGFHLACDARNDKAVQKLRNRKSRQWKPFAIMVKDTAMARQHCYLSSEEIKALTGWQKPIVLLRKKPGSKISDLVAPGNSYLGVMLPYTPLHYLLFARFSSPPLVMTSGNLSDEPIEIDNEEALDRLSHIADYFLIHNRDIHNRCDDSIVQVFEGESMIIRRARGYAPLPIALDSKVQSVLACGAELKNTFCLTKGKYAFLSQYIGDLKEYRTLHYYEEMIDRFKRLFGISPQIVAHDLHPDYLSTRYALNLKEDKPETILVPVQHHHAHIVSCLVENRVKQKVIGVAFDGVGYGQDGNVWGGEFLLADYGGFKRVAQLKYLPLPGGDKAVQEAWRMGISFLVDAFGYDLPPIDFVRRREKEINLILEMMGKGINSPLSSSMGRLFDAISSLIGLCDENTYEGQAAMELESLARVVSHIKGAYHMKVVEKDGFLIAEPDELIKEIVADLRKGISLEIIAHRFHNSVAIMVADVCVKIRESTGLAKVALSGGVFQNRLLLGKIVQKLTEEGFLCYYQTKVPTNDGGVSLGQAMIANEIVRRRRYVA